MEYLKFNLVILVHHNSKTDLATFCDQRHLQVVILEEAKEAITVKGTEAQSTDNFPCSVIGCCIHHAA